uniref:Gag-Pol polyprotein n=1 Tax=Bactrocera latifrons TaxID=174628 RepID=A0A0K8WI33_BACLA
MLNWIVRYGVPARITSDQGMQFQSDLFNKLNNLLGARHIVTTAYHPKANGIVERLHRQLKAALLCHNESWYDALPAVLLGLRSAWKELVYGETIRLPGEFIAPSSRDLSAPELIKVLQNHFRGLTPAEMSRKTNYRLFKFRDLDHTSHVFVRRGQIGPSFSHPYDGPYRVAARYAKYFTVHINGKDIPVSIDRLKPAYIVANDQGTLDYSEAAAQNARTRKKQKKKEKHVHFAT